MNYQSSQRYVETMWGLQPVLEKVEVFPPFLIMLTNLPLSSIDAEDIGDYYRHTLSTFISLKTPTDIL